MLGRWDVGMLGRGDVGIWDVGMLTSKPPNDGTLGCGDVNVQTSNVPPSNLQTSKPPNLLQGLGKYKCRSNRTPTPDRRKHKKFRYEKRRLILPMFLAIWAMVSAFYVWAGKLLPDEQRWVDSVYNAMSEEDAWDSSSCCALIPTWARYVDKIKRLISEYQVGGLCFSGNPRKTDRPDQRIPATVETGAAADRDRCRMVCV